MANEFQQALLQSYPNIDLLPLDVSDVADVAFQVKADATADTLFSFLWRELGDAEGKDEAVKNLMRAMSDIQTVIDAIDTSEDFEEAA